MYPLETNRNWKKMATFVVHFYVASRFFNLKWQLCLEKYLNGEI